MVSLLDGHEFVVLIDWLSMSPGMLWGRDRSSAHGVERALPD